MNNWSEWSCDRTIGEKTRTRATIQPALNGGITCGPTKDTQRCVRDCQMTNWTDWTCDNNTGIKTRTRHEKTLPRNELDDNGILQYGVLCGPTVERLECRVDCVMKDWSPWSSCDIYTGKMKRTREPQFYPRYGGEPCGINVEYSSIGCPLPSPHIMSINGGPFYFAYRYTIYWFHNTDPYIGLTGIEYSLNGGPFVSAGSIANPLTVDSFTAVKSVIMKVVNKNGIKSLNSNPYIMAY
jgi:hypothetical protein